MLRIVLWNGTLLRRSSVLQLDVCTSKGPRNRLEKLCKDWLRHVPDFMDRNYANHDVCDAPCHWLYSICSSWLPLIVRWVECMCWCQCFSSTEFLPSYLPLYDVLCYLCEKPRCSDVPWWMLGSQKPYHAWTYYCISLDSKWTSHRWIYEVLKVDLYRLLNLLSHSHACGRLHSQCPTRLKCYGRWWECFHFMLRNHPTFPLHSAHYR